MDNTKFDKDHFDFSDSEDDDEVTLDDDVIDDDVIEHLNINYTQQRNDNDDNHHNVEYDDDDYDYDDDEAIGIDETSTSDPSSIDIHDGKTMTRPAVAIVGGIFAKKHHDTAATPGGNNKNKIHDDGDEQDEKNQTLKIPIDPDEDDYNKNMKKSKSHTDTDDSVAYEPNSPIDEKRKFHSGDIVGDSITAGGMVIGVVTLEHHHESKKEEESVFNDGASEQCTEQEKTSTIDPASGFGDVGIIFKNSDDKDDDLVSWGPKKKLQVDPSFHIVLVDIRKAAEQRHIHCEPFLLDGQTPYVALSYRWGELDEQMVRATADYSARIVSFQLDDFFKLCQAILHEPDLKHVEYVWVDAICVDQTNVEKRKATIYRMNDIYIHANAIVAVPDLHAHHLSITTTANNDMMEVIQNYRRYLYYLLVGTPEAQQTLVDMDHQWMNDLGVPTMKDTRLDLILATQKQHQQSIQERRGFKSNQQKKASDSRSARFLQKMTLLLATNQQDINNEDHYQQLSSHMMMEFQRLEWQQKFDQRQSDIIQSMKFLQSLMEDWSNRTWVISEYHIAKKKTGKLKFWFNQLSCPELHGLGFFEFDFTIKRSILVNLIKQAQNNLTRLQQNHPYTYRIVYLTNEFKDSMRTRLTRRTVLEMMLQTRASRNDDRFHAIIPLVPKYKHYIKDRHSIQGLGISDMLSVQLKLMEWIDIKDTLILLYSERHTLPSAVPSFPTFATSFKNIKPGLAKLVSKYAKYCNYNIKYVVDDDDDDDDNNKDVRLIRSQDHTLDELWLCPRIYYTRPCPMSVISHDMGHLFWHAIGIDPSVSTMDIVSIPLFTGIQKNSSIKLDQTITECLDSTMELIGCFEKNIWIRAPSLGNVSPMGTIMVMDKQQFARGFRIY